MGNLFPFCLLPKASFATSHLYKSETASFVQSFKAYVNS